MPSDIPGPSSSGANELALSRAPALRLAEMDHGANLEAPAASETASTRSKAPADAETESSRSHEPPTTPVDERETAARTPPVPPSLRSNGTNGSIHMEHRTPEPHRTAAPPAVPRDDVSSATARDPESLEQVPNRASLLPYFGAQMARHLVPVAGVRTAVQGVAAPSVAKLIETHPDGALAAQLGLASLSLVRSLRSTWHSEQDADVASHAFLGEPPEAAAGHTARRVWQGVQRAGAVAADVASVVLTAMSRKDPRLLPIAQAMANIQFRAHVLSSGRELLRPAINTVHVGRRDAVMPENGRLLTPGEIGWKEKLTYGGAAAAIEFVSQLLMQLTLGGRPAWDAGLKLAAGAGAIAGLANTVSSSVEDTIIDTAVEKHLQKADASHTRTIHWDSKNPFSMKELARQLERVDTRIFNQMVPAMIAFGVLQAMHHAISSDWKGRAATAGINALVNGVVLGSLLSLTARSYQMNDHLREHFAANRETPT
jgi:hypothetical protein